jgi:S-DNA-T family DNA segregation ATPase FtsK/SpoIIIE
MVKKPFRGKHLNLEDTRISYDVKTDSISLTSKDPDLPKGKGFKITMNRGRDAEYILRELLEKEGVIPKDRFKTITHHTSYLDASSHERWNVIPLGIHANNEETRWYVEDAPHALVVGRAGSGKTNLVRNLMYHCLQNPSEWEVFAIDLKGDENKHFAAKNPNVIKLTNSPAEAIEYIRRVHAEMHMRYEEISSVNAINYRDIPSRPPATMLILDGLETLMYPGRDIFSPSPTDAKEIRAEGNLRQEMISRLTEISRLGRAAGIHLVILTQRASVEYLHTELRSNLTVRIATSRLSAQQSQILFYDDSASYLYEDIKGRGYIRNMNARHDGGADFQAFFFPHDALAEK